MGGTQRRKAGGHLLTPTLRFVTTPGQCLLTNVSDLEKDICVKEFEKLRLCFRKVVCVSRYLEYTAVFVIICRAQNVYFDFFRR